MNQHTLKTFEYYSILEKVKEYSLTEEGKNFILNIKPYTDFADVEKLLLETGDAMSFLNNNSHPLRGLKSIKEPLKMLVHSGILSPIEIWNIANNLQIISNFQQIMKNRVSYPYLNKIIRSIADFPDLTRNIMDSIAEDGTVLDNASAELKTIRKRILILKERLRSAIEGIVNSSNYKALLQDFYITERNGRWVVPVKSDFKNSFPGIVHDVSSSGSTVFMEPLATIPLSNEIVTLEKKEIEEIKRILKDFSEKLKSHLPDLENLLQTTIYLESLFARALFGASFRGVIPELVKDKKIEIIGGKHPLLNVEVVPVDIEIGTSYRTLIITGPNTGGKTVTLKMVGLFTLLVQSGFPIPVFKATFGVFPKIFADIGDEQSITQNMSTFSSHIGNISSFIKDIDDTSLVILDELGAGTDPQEGSSLAYSITTYIHSLKPLLIISTHHGNLKTFPYSFPLAANGSMEFNLESLKPTYRLIIGVPGRSYALFIASNLGIPETIIAQANSYLPESQKEFSELVKSLEKARLSYEAKRKEYDLLSSESEETIAYYNNQIKELKSKKQKILSEIRLEGKEEIEKALTSMKEALKSLSDQKISLKVAQKIYQEQKERAESFLNTLQSREQEAVKPQDLKTPEDIIPGDEVFVETLGKFGTVLKIFSPKKTALIQIGSLNTEIPVKLIKVRTNPSKNKERLEDKSYTSMVTYQNIPPIIDLHGMRGEEALILLDQYIEQSYLSNYKQVRIIHGIGKGILKRLVRDYLKKHPYISHYLADPDEGDGVTLAFFNR
ncbi:MAG: Endonuclease MutS2 [candidate division WS2 bacterium]|nr:Endonuclease MutS2 [Candidatus Lithacetigena glycinireducens]